ncbi:MAG: hypothetical protein MK073_01530 [Phycisphaerales bacterium]|nr:hypothetical protein [Phycisphaerales bacterium]
MKRLAFVLVLALSACQQSQNPWVECSQSSDDMHVQFVIEHDGKMTYRGGMDVIAERDTWIYQLGQEDIERIQMLLSALTMEHIDSTQVVLVNGTQMYGDEECKALLAKLRQLASSRFDAVIDGLPKPSADVLIQRSIEVERHEQEARQSAE